MAELIAKARYNVIDGRVSAVTRRCQLFFEKPDLYGEIMAW